MSTLYQHLRSELVPPRVKTMAAEWQVWDSAQEGVGDTIHIDYDGEYGSERVLIVSGRATVVWPFYTFPALSSQISRNHFRPDARKFPGNFQEICDFFSLSADGPSVYGREKSQGSFRSVV